MKQVGERSGFHLTPFRVRPPLCQTSPTGEEKEPTSLAQVTKPGFELA